MFDALKESNKMFSEAMATMSASFAQVADSMRKSMEQLANMNTQMMSSSNFSYAHTPERFGCSGRVVPQPLLQIDITTELSPRVIKLKVAIHRILQQKVI